MWYLGYLSSAGGPPRRGCTAPVLTVLLVFALGLWVAAQQTPPPPPPSSTPSQPAPAEAGGPQGDIGPMAVPKKGETPPEPKPAPPKKIENMPEYSITVDTSLVQVPVLVTTKDGQFIPGLKAGNFRVLEDGVPQKITKFEVSHDTPITAVLVVEFAARWYRFMYDALNASYVFAQTLKPQDWVAVIDFDMRPHILADFTQDKRQVFAALNSLQIPGFSETNVFDALYDTLDRVSGIEGHKYVVLVASGCDTFSRMTLDKVLKKIKDTPDVTIFTISTGEALRIWAEAYGGGGTGLFPCSVGSSIDFLQADNQMNTFAKMTGGRWFKPRFEGELPEIFRDIGQNIRNEYVLAYHPTNSKLDGTSRKLKVEVVGPDGGPLHVRNEKGKDLKYQVVAREGYTAKHQVE